MLARAGLARLGRLDAVTEVIDPVQMLPAPGQGALAVECRSPDDAGTTGSPTCSHVLDDAATRLVVTAERTLLAALEAGCSAPVGALGEAADGEHAPRAVPARRRQCCRRLGAACGCPPPDLSTRLHGSAATSRLTCSPRVRPI